MTSNLTFGGGMNTDITNAFRQPSTYLNAENFTFTSKGSDNIGSLEAVKGNEADTTVVFDDYQKLVGYVRLQEDVVYFTSSDTTGISKIYYLDLDGVMNTIYEETTTGELNFSTDSEYRVVGIGRIESDTIRKVYFIDGVNQLRVIDVNRDYTGVDVTALDVIPEVDVDISIEAVAKAGGSYTSGVVQYAYQLYSKNGPDSTISPLSFPVRLALRNDDSTASGGDVDVSVNKSVAITISGFSDDTLARFDRIKVFAIFYTDSTESPTISTVGSYSFNSDNFTCVDLGETLGDIEVDDFTSYKQTTYIPGAIEEKDNYLFLANIEESTFHSTTIDDWDSRAYRFDSSGHQANIYDVGTEDSLFIAGANHTTVDEFKMAGGTSSEFVLGESVPTEFDCWNRYNSIYTGNASYPYKYRSSGSSEGIGGTGLNIEYYFVNSTTTIDSAPTTSYKVISPMDDSHTHGDTYECQSGEVYRVGVKFINSKGQSSFVKWVGDVLWEEEFTEDKVYYDTTAVTSRAKSLVVSILNFPDDDNIVAWQIVRAKRESSDRSVVMNGLLAPVVEWSTEDFYRPFARATHTILDYFPMVSTQEYFNRATDDTIGTQTVPGKLFKFISPDAMFNSPADNNIADYKVRAYNKATGGTVTYSRTPDAGTNYFTWASYKIRQLETLGTVSTKTPKSIVDFKYVSPVAAKASESDTYNLITNSSGTNFKYLNQVHVGGEDTDNYCASASSFILTLEDDLDLDTTETGSEEYFYVSLLKDVDITRYGGCSYQAITNTEYIDFSDIKADVVGTSFIYATKGDIWTTMFYMMDFMYWDDSASVESGESLLTFPVESVIDTRYRLDRILDYYSPPATFTDRAETMFIQETVEEGLAYDVEQGYITYDEDLGDLYRYNTAYSNQGGIIKSYSKPIDFELNSVNSTKVMHSDKKSNGESVDSWSNFPTANFIEVSPKYGKVNTLLNTDNKLFFWQNTAFGKLAVNERSLLGDTTGQQLSLGSGDILERYDYISNKAGNSDKYNVSFSEDAIYWTNSKDGNIYLYNNKLADLGTSLNISNYLVGKGDILDPISIADGYNNETLFKLNDEVLVFDWLTKKFTGIYTYDPQWFIDRYDKGISSIPKWVDFPVAVDVIYNHDSDSTRATFYDTTYPSTIKHVCNENYDNTKSFDTLNWESKSVDSDGTDIYGDTFGELRIYNSYQNTQSSDGSWKTLSTSSDPVTLTRKERTFRTTIPRDNVNATQDSNVNIFDTSNLDETQTYKRRIRDKYIVIDLEYDNTSGNVFSVPYINVNYRKSTR